MQGFQWGGNDGNGKVRGSGLYHRGGVVLLVLCPRVCIAGALIQPSSSPLLLTPPLPLLANHCHCRRHFAEALNLKRGNLRALMGLRMSSRESALRPAKVNDKKGGALVDGSVADIEVAQKLHEFACEEIERVTKGKYGDLGAGLMEIGRREGEEIVAAMANKAE